MNYDSTEDTKKHIENVGNYLNNCIDELKHRKENHDYDKIHNEIEKKLFDEYTPKLHDCTYGSQEYKSYLSGLKPALDLHYANNRHHPEHYKNGIKDMTLIDLIEMLCDWKASSERHADGNIMKSIKINQSRFNYSDELKQIFINTINYIKK